MRSHKPTLCALLLLCSSTTLCGQSTIVVDRLGSGQFTDLPPAVAYASPNDVIVVLPGAYTPPNITKPLKIYGSPSAALTQGTMTISQINAGETLTIANLCTLGCGGLSSTYNSLVIRDCAGFVHMQSVHINRSLLSSTTRIGLHIDNCRQVSANECAFLGDPGVLIENVSTVAITDTFCAGTTLAPPGPKVNGLEGRNSTIFLNQCSIYGGPGYDVISARRPRGDGINMFGGQIYVNGDSQARVEPGSIHPQSIGTPGPGYSFETNYASVFIHPSIPNLSFSPTSSPGPTYVAMPSVSVASASPGYAMSTVYRVPGGGAAALAMAAPAIDSIYPLVWEINHYFLDNGAFNLLYVRSATPSTTIQYGVYIPNATSLRGIPLTFQGFYDNLAGIQRFSNPAMVVIE